MKKKFTFSSILTFFLIMTICLIIIIPASHSMITAERISLEQLNTDNTIRISEAISRPINQIYTASKYIEHNNGDLSRFDELANIIVDSDYVRNLILAPDGVVQYVYPNTEENRSVLGLDYYSNSSEGNREAITAAQEHKLLLAGPFTTVVGDTAISGRIPVFLTDKNGDRTFWGIVSITLQYPEILENTYIDNLTERGITYNLWHKNIDTGEHQIILSNGSIDEDGSYIDKHIDLLNSEWYLRLSPVRKWYEFYQIWNCFLVAVFISILVSIVVHKNKALNVAKKNLEFMLNYDQLTKVLNRHGLFSVLNDLIKSNTVFQLNYIDLNRFKYINDTFGHTTGDFILAEFARRISKYIDDNHFFARISGDEFIIIYTGKDFESEAEKEFWQNIYKEFDSPITTINDEDIFISFSKGYSVYPDDSDKIDDIISIADEKMYLDKKKNK